MIDIPDFFLIKKIMHFPFFTIFFLALLDYVRRAHEIEFCPTFVVRRPSVLQLSLNLMHRFLSKLGCCFP